MQTYLFIQNYNYCHSIIKIELKVSNEGFLELLHSNLRKNSEMLSFENILTKRVRKNEKKHLTRIKANKLHVIVEAQEFCRTMDNVVVLLSMW